MVKHTLERNCKTCVWCEGILPGGRETVCLHKGGAKGCRIADGDVYQNWELSTRTKQYVASRRANLVRQLRQLDSDCAELGVFFDSSGVPTDKPWTVLQNLGRSYRFEGQEGQDDE